LRKGAEKNISNSERGWRRLHNEVPHNLYASPNVRVIKSRKMRWVVHVAQTREMRNAYNILV
jgi:hypothetical protein